MNFSFCIITKNEKENIERCVNALIPCEREIVVVDTGSDDGTVELLEKMSTKHPLIKVRNFEWCDDFAAAKNYAIEQASCEYVFVIDSDEFVTQIDVSGIEALIMANPDSVGRMHRRNVFEGSGVNQENVEWVNRIFSREKYHYVGRIHEQIVRRDNADEVTSSIVAGELVYDTYRAPVSVLHTGYDMTDNKREAKARRNIALLEKEKEDPYILYQLGKSYYMLGDYPRACEYFEKGLEYDLDPRLEYVSDMVETYGYALINSSRAQDALMFENIYDEFGYTADFHFLMGLIYMNNALFGEAIEEFERATKFEEAKMVGVNGAMALYNIGVIKECTGDISVARDFYKKCGDFGPALERLKQSK